LSQPVLAEGRTPPAFISTDRESLKDFDGCVLGNQQSSHRLRLFGFRLSHRASCSFQLRITPRPSGRKAVPKLSIIECCIYPSGVVETLVPLQPKRRQS